MFNSKSFKGYLKKIVSVYSLKFFLNSVRGFIIDVLRNGNILKRLKPRKNGISVLLPTQNEEQMVKLSILSLLDFADEIIIVDNGSIDNTKKIIQELVNQFQKVKFYDKPELSDLHHNRQFALTKSKYRWICRFDSDYVAYTSGKNNIQKLRRYLLNLPRSFLPKVINLYKVNIDGDFWHVRVDKFSSTGKVIRGPEPRIYEFFPFLAFTRFGRREYVSFQEFLHNIILKTVFYMHCTIKSSFNLFLRSERTNWRELGDFKKYPTLLSYIRHKIKKKYHTEDLKGAVSQYVENKIFNEKNYIKYDVEKYLPYPSLILKEMENGNVFRIEDYFKN